MSPKRVSPDDAQPSQPTATVQSPQPTNLTAETTKGHLLTGLHASGKCRLTSKGKPVAFQDIDWYVGTGGEYLGTSQTDQRGIATIEGGSISDIGTSVMGEIGGYSVKYNGNEEYLPSEAHGRVVPIFGIS